MAAGTFILVGSVTLLGGAYGIAHLWAKLIAFGERRYVEVYGDDPYIVELLGYTRTRAEKAAARALDDTDGGCPHHERGL